MTTTTSSPRWVDLLGADPRPWLRSSDEASARWITLHALDAGPDHGEVAAAREAAVASPMVQALIDGLPPWGEDAVVSGHHSPAYLPNLLGWVHDLGVRAGDDPRVDDAVSSLAKRQTDDGRFPSFEDRPGHPEPGWGAVPCDTHSITEVLVRFDRLDEPATRRGLERLAADLADTTQGRGWTCIPDPVMAWRGPGRKGDVCPQVTLEALRTFARVPAADRPDGLEDAADTVLRAWSNRAEEHPYMFGHGKRFKTVKWPPLWYGVFWVLDTLGRYPRYWRTGPEARRRQLAELLACLIAYNVDADGTVTPRSIYRGFATHSWGQKKQPSPVATALVAGVVRRLDDLATDALDVDVAALPSSREDADAPIPPPVR